MYLYLENIFDPLGLLKFFNFVNLIVKRECFKWFRKGPYDWRQSKFHCLRKNSPYRLMYIGISKWLWKFHFSIDKSYSTQNTVDWEVSKGCSCKSLWHFNYVQSCLSKYEGVVWWLKRRIQERYNPRHMFRKWRNVVSSDSYKLHFLLLPKNVLPALSGSYLRSSYTWGTRDLLLVLTFHLLGTNIKYKIYAWCHEKCNMASRAEGF